jgi:hypothetical protein
MDDIFDRRVDLIPVIVYENTEEIRWLIVGEKMKR